MSERDKQYSEQLDRMLKECDDMFVQIDEISTTLNNVDDIFNRIQKANGKVTSKEIVDFIGNATRVAKTLVATKKVITT